VNSKPISPRTDLDVLTGAAKALGWINRDGLRGITKVSVDDIENMALALIILGLVPISPDPDGNQDLIIHKGLLK
jgi:hypothetical protein